MATRRQMSGEPSHTRLVDALLAILIGAAAFTLYAMTLAPTVLGGDGGEFQFVPYIVGVAHPTGYPLYCLLGWVWSHLLPIGDVAYRMNLFSALWAALAVGLLVPTIRLFLEQILPDLSGALLRITAALAAAFFAVTPTFWSQAVIAEVYSLHIFLLVLVLYLLLRHRLVPAALAFGLSLAHHRTTLLWIPALALYLWLTEGRALFHRKLLVRALLAMLLPLLLYLYIPLRAPHTPYFHLPLAAGQTLDLYENSAAGFLDFITGGPFGGSVDLSVDLGGRLAMAWGLFLGEIGWVAVGLALSGLVWLAAARRWAPLLLTCLSLILSAGFNLFYMIGDVFVLFIPTYLITAIWMAIGLAALARAAVRLASSWVARGHRRGSPSSGAAPLARRAAAVGIAVLLPFLALPGNRLLTKYGDLDQSRNCNDRQQWETILAEPFPTGAILVSNDRNEIMPMWYLQYVGDAGPARPDLTGLFPLIAPELSTLGHVLDLALGTGRPVYLIKEMPGVEVKVEVVREGRLWRVTGPVTAEPTYPRDLYLGEAVSLVGFDRSPRSPRPGDSLQVSLYWESLRPLDREYHTFVHLLDAGGTKLAQSDRQPGGDYYPAPLWRPGERVRDVHLLSLPDGMLPGLYRLVAGMYDLDDDGTVRPLGEPTEIGQVAVKGDVQASPAPPKQPVGKGFGDQVELLGYDVQRQAGQVLVQLQWRTIKPPAADYTVFVHLLDADGQMVAQHDSQPRGGAYPTSVWDAGEIVVDDHPLVVPADLPAGPYRLRIGLYLLPSGDRLLLDGGGDSVTVGPIQISD